MPPQLNKAKKSQVTILKFKRAKSTYLIPLELGTKSSQTIGAFTASIAGVIEESGGLRLVEEDPNDVDDIEIPKSEFIDDDEAAVEVPKSEFDENVSDPVADSNVVIKISPEEIRIAVPTDKSSPYANEWIELSKDSDLTSLVFNDYDIIAFAYLEEPFNVIEAAYEEQA